MSILNYPIFAVLKKGLLMVMGCCALGAQAQIGGTGVYSILKMPSNARTSAWGGYCPAYIKADVSFMNNNPALLGNAALNTVTSNFNTQFPGVWSGNGGYATKYKNIGYFGATAAFINYGSMKAYDAGGNAEGEVAANETVLSLGYAKPYNKNIQYGASAKMVYSILAGYVSSAMAFDIGATYTQDDSILSAGLVMRNAGFMVQHYRDGEREPLPFQVELGVNFKPRHMPFRFNLVAHNLQKFDLTYNQYLKSNSIDLNGQTSYAKEAGFGEKVIRHLSVGTELVLGPGFGVLFGYNHQRRKELAPEAISKVTGFSWGLYLKVSKFNITYSSAAYFPGYNMNLFTFSARLSDFKKKTASSQQSSAKG